MASTTTLRTIVAIAAPSMLEIRLAMRHLWRQSSDRLDLDQASGGAPRARGGVAFSKIQSVDQRTRLGNAVSAFANCGRAVAHVQGSYVPTSEVQHPDTRPRLRM